MVCTSYVISVLPAPQKKLYGCVHKHTSQTKETQLHCEANSPFRVFVSADYPKLAHQQPQLPVAAMLQSLLHLSILSQAQH
jgi:hypothetical protein